MGKKPFFSIITISFNSEKTIERTIKSVLAQTNKNYEYIVVDGNSKDATLDIIKKYEPLFEGRMSWKSEPDKGIYDAMNKGICRSKGDMIGIVNSDDWLEPDALENVWNAFEENGKSLDAVYCGWIKFHYDNGDVQVMKTNHEFLKKWAESKYEVAGIRHPAVFVPLKLYDRFGVFDEKMKIKADTDLLLRLYFGKVEFFYFNIVVTNMADGGVSNSSYLKACNDYKAILKKYDVSGLHYFKLYALFYLKALIKNWIPQSFIMKYRKLGH